MTECNHGVLVLWYGVVWEQAMVAHLSDTSLLGQHLMGVVTLQRQVNTARQEQAELRRQHDEGGGVEEEEEKKDDREGRGAKRGRDQRSPSPPLTGCVVEHTCMIKRLKVPHSSRVGPSSAASRMR